MPWKDFNHSTMCFCDKADSMEPDVSFASSHRHCLVTLHSTVLAAALFSRDPSRKTLPSFLWLSGAVYHQRETRNSIQFFLPFLPSKCQQFQDLHFSFLIQCPKFCKFLTDEVSRVSHFSIQVWVGGTTIHFHFLMAT